MNLEEREKSVNDANRLQRIISKLKSGEGENALNNARGVRAIIISLYLRGGKDGLNPGELSRILGVGSGRIGNALKFLEAKGYVTRQSCPDDLRKKNVRLSPSGIKLAKESYEDFLDNLTFVRQKMGDERFDSFIELLQEVIEITDEYRKQKGVITDA